MSYKVWEEGEGPDFVLEVASPNTWEEDVERKPGIYAALGSGSTSCSILRGSTTRRGFRATGWWTARTSGCRRWSPSTAR